MTVKELEALCKKICEDGKGNYPVSIFVGQTNIRQTNYTFATHILYDYTQDKVWIGGK